MHSNSKFNPRERSGEIRASPWDSRGCDLARAGWQTVAGGGSRSEGVGRPHAGRPHTRKPQAPSGHGSLTASASPGFSFRPNAKPCSQDRFCPQPVKFSAPPGGPSEAVTALGLMVEKRPHARFVDSTGGNVSVCLLPAGQRASRRGDSGAHGGQQARRGPGFHEVGVHSLTHSLTHSLIHSADTCAPAPLWALVLWTATRHGVPAALLVFPWWRLTINNVETHSSTR